MNMQTQTPVLTAASLYDSLMEGIEPDLTTKNIGKLDALYAGETAEEKMLRLEQYEFAFAVFEQAMSATAGLLQADVQALKEECMKAALTTQQHADAAAIKDIEDALEEGDFRA